LVRFTRGVGLKDKIGLVGVGVGTVSVVDIVTVTDLNEQDREDAAVGSSSASVGRNSQSKRLNRMK
jgi:hypothetical protein